VVAVRRTRFRHPLRALPTEHKLTLAFGGARARAAGKHELHAPHRFAGDRQSRMATQPIQRLRSFFPQIAAPLGRAHKSLCLETCFSFVQSVCLQSKISCAESAGDFCFTNGDGRAHGCTSPVPCVRRPVRHAALYRLQSEWSHGRCQTHRATTGSLRLGSDNWAGHPPR